MRICLPGVLLAMCGALVAEGPLLKQGELNITPLDESVDIKELPKNSKVRTIPHTKKGEIFNLTPKERDQLFKEAGLLDAIAKYDDLDRDRILHFASKNDLRSLNKNYRDMAFDETKLKKLSDLFHQSTKR